MTRPFAGYVAMHPDEAMAHAWPHLVVPAVTGSRPEARVVETPGPVPTKEMDPGDTAPMETDGHFEIKRRDADEAKRELDQLYEDWAKKASARRDEEHPEPPTVVVDRETLDAWVKEQP